MINKVDIVLENSYKLQLLIQEETKELFNKIHERDVKARERLINGNFRLVLRKSFCGKENVPMIYSKLVMWG